MTEAAVEWWGKAGQRSLERSALIEAAEQLTRALNQTERLPGTPALRREQIKLQVALANALMHLKDYAAPEPKAALERARVFMERAEAFGEPPEDPLILFFVLYGFWAAHYLAFDGDVCRELTEQFLALAEKQPAKAPRMIGHRITGHTQFSLGNFAQARSHYDKAVELYDAAEHRPLATRFGQHTRVAVLSYRSWALWILGYPAAALVDAERALTEAREIGHAPTTMFALGVASVPYFETGI